METAEIVSVDVDRPVELAPEVEGTKKRRTLPVLFSFVDGIYIPDEATGIDPRDEAPAA